MMVMPPSPPMAPMKDPKLSAGATIGISVGGTAFLALVIFGAWRWVTWRKKAHKRKQQQQQHARPAAAPGGTPLDGKQHKGGGEGDRVSTDSASRDELVGVGNGNGSKPVVRTASAVSWHGAGPSPGAGGEADDTGRELQSIRRAAAQGRGARRMSAGAEQGMAFLGVAPQLQPRLTGGGGGSTRMSTKDIVRLSGIVPGVSPPSGSMQGLRNLKGSRDVDGACVHVRVGAGPLPSVRSALLQVSLACGDAARPARLWADPPTCWLPCCAGRWADLPADHGCVAVEEGVTAAALDVAVVAGAGHAGSGSGPPPVELTAEQVQQQVELVASGLIDRGEPGRAQGLKTLES